MYNDQCLDDSQYGAGLLKSGQISESGTDIFFEKLEQYLIEGQNSGIFKKISFEAPEKLSYEPIDETASKKIIENTKDGKYKEIFVDNLTSTSLKIFNVKGAAPFAPAAFDPSGLFPVKLDISQIPQFLIELSVVVSTGLLAVPSFAAKWEIDESFIIDFIGNLPQLTIPPVPPIPLPLPQPNLPTPDFVATFDIFSAIPQSLLTFFSSVFVPDLNFAKSILSFDILSLLKQICSKLIDLFVTLFEAVGIDFSISFLLKATIFTIVELLAAAALTCIVSLLVGTGSISKSVFDFVIDG